MLHKRVWCGVSYGVVCGLVQGFMHYGKCGCGVWPVGGRSAVPSGSRSGPGPDLSGQNLRNTDVSSQTRVANHFGVAPSVHGVPHIDGWMKLVKPHPTI